MSDPKEIAAMRNSLASQVREAWAYLQAQEPARRGLLYAMIPCPDWLTLASIPRIPGCISVEIIFSIDCPKGDTCFDDLCILHQPKGLKFFTRIGDDLITQHPFIPPRLTGENMCAYASMGVTDTIVYCMRPRSEHAVGPA